MATHPQWFSDLLKRAQQNQPDNLRPLEAQAVREFLATPAAVRLATFLAGPTMAGARLEPPIPEDGFGWALARAHKDGVEAACAAVIRLLTTMMTVPDGTDDQEPDGA